jgi:hypothetical protein
MRSGRYGEVLGDAPLRVQAATSGTLSALAYLFILAQYLRTQETSGARGGWTLRAS